MIGVFLLIQAGVRVSSMHKRPAPDKKENTVKKALAAPARSEVLIKETTCESSTPSWASDHNYNAVKPEPTAALWPALLYKCMYHLGVASGPFPGFLPGPALGPGHSQELWPAVALPVSPAPLPLAGPHKAVQTPLRLLCV